MKTQSLLIVALSGCLLSCHSRAAEPQAAPQKPDIALPCMIVGAVAAGFVVWSIYECAKAAGLTSPPPPPPPITTTNAPPATNAIAHASASTRTVNLTAQPKMFGTTLPILATNNDFATELKQDISTNGWTDWEGNPYTWLFLTDTDPDGPMTQTSTNLVDWHPAIYSVAIWASSTESPDPGMAHFANMAVVLSQDGIPLMTNWCAIKAGGVVNLGIPRTGPQMFFKVSN